MNPLELVKLTTLMEITGGRAETIVGLIDGPVAKDHPGLVGENIRDVPGKVNSDCVQANETACNHGTFVAGLLCGKRGGVAPAICPNCTLLVRPIFAEATVRNGQMPSATPEELAAAIIECIEAGARVLNLSVALAQPSSLGMGQLEEALDYAVMRGVIAVAAAGNQGTLGSSAITRHPGVIPVVACDLKGKPISQSNLGGSIGRRGLSAPGENITSLGTEGKPLTLGGTSAAAPFVTGTIALLWSEFPTATAAEVKLAITQAYRRRRTTVVPLLLDAWGAYQVMLKTNLRVKQGVVMDSSGVTEQSTNQPLNEEDVSAMPKAVQGTQNASSYPTSSNSTGASISPQAGDGACSCGGMAGNANGIEMVEPTYIYALGRVEARFPSKGIEKEFAQAMGRAETVGQTDREAFYNVLSQRQNRYLVRQLCWVLTIEGLETYILQPTCPADLELLVEAVRPAPSPMDVDIVIGRRGPIAPPQICNGLMVPIVAFDQIYSFDISSLIESIPRPESIEAEQFRPAAEELFMRIMQLADNAGATEEHRALNYLAVRYPAIYAQSVDAFGRSSSLTGVELRPSRLSGVRKVMDVIFVYTNRQTDVAEKYFVRVDVTEEFPFLVTKLSPYYDR